MRGATRLDWGDLTGWAEDDHAAGLAAWTRSGGAAPAGAGRDWVEARFVPWLLPAAHFTGYYEPELHGSPVRTDAFPVPIHAAPPMGIGASRAEIEAGDLLAGQEIAWLADEVDRFFLQVQGSGRVRFPDGTVLRVGHAAKNGHPYRSVGALLVERGVFAADRITAQGVMDWLRADPARGRAAMRENPSYVMFRALRGGAAEDGPPGAMGVPVTEGRSLAVDPAVVPLGALVWAEVDAPDPIRRLCAAQDVGSAIVGVGRADLFCGTGDAAGRMAGALNHGGRMVVLEPA